MEKLNVKLKWYHSYWYLFLSSVGIGYLVGLMSKLYLPTTTLSLFFYIIITIITCIVFGFLYGFVWSKNRNKYIEKQQEKMLEKKFQDSIRGGYNG